MVVAAVVDEADVPGVEPAAAQRLGRRGLVPPVAGHDVGAAHQDLSAPARRNVRSIGVHDPGVAIERRLAGGSRAAPGVLDPLVDRDRGGLGGAVDLDHGNAAVEIGVEQRPRHDGRTGRDASQAGKIDVRPGGVVDDGPHQRGHQDHQVRAFSRQRGEGRIGFETGLEDDFGAGAERRDRMDVEPADMEHRQVGQHAVAARHVVGGDGVGGVEGDRRLGEHRPLGAARGAGGVGEHERRFEPRPAAGGLRAGPRHEVVQPGRVDRPAVGKVRHGGGGAFREARLEDEDLAAGVRERISEFRDRQTPVQGHQHRAGPRAGEKQRDQVRAVVAEIGDARPGPDVQPVGEDDREAADETAQGAVADLPPLPGNRGSIRGEAGPELDPVGDVHDRAQPSVSPGS